jgi:hypothetical protein
VPVAKAPETVRHRASGALPEGKTPKLGKMTIAATSPKSRRVNASAKAFSHDQDPELT